MQIFFVTISIVLSTIEINTSIASSNYKNLQLCMQSKTVAVQIFAGADNDLTCQCQASRVKSGSSVREDYTHTLGVGSHKLHVIAKTWNEARKICKEENAHLAIINSKVEEEVLLKMLRAAVYNIQQALRNEQAFLGVHDMFQEGEWLTVFGESLESTGYAQWTDAFLPHVQPDNAGGNQNCGTLIAKGGLDDERCFEKLAFFCELPLSCRELAAATI